MTLARREVDEKRDENVLNLGAIGVNRRCHRAKYQKIRRQRLGALDQSSSHVDRAPGRTPPAFRRRGRPFGFSAHVALNDLTLCYRCCGLTEDDTDV